MKHVVISLLNFNNKNDTLECVNSLAKIRINNFKLTIVVVDNASIENLTTAELRRKLNPKVDLKLILNEKNVGFSGGNNIAIEYALKNMADYVLILNNDTYVDQNFLIELLNVSEKDKTVGIAVPKIYFAPGFEFHKDKYFQKEIGKVIWYAGGEMDWANLIGHHRGVNEVDRGEFNKIDKTEFATGCCMLIKKEVFEKIGLFDEKYFLYYEDSDLSMRTIEVGFKIVYVPNSKIWHKNAGSTGGSGSSLQDYFITRNRLMFAHKFASTRTKLALFKESMLLLIRGRKWQKKGVEDYYLGRFGKGSYKL